MKDIKTIATYSFGAVTGTLAAVLGLNLLADSIFASPVPEKPGYAIAAAETHSTPAAAGATGASAAPQQSLGARLATADAAKGAASAKVCMACHDFTKDGPNKVGPNLWAIVDHNMAARPGFAYSEAFKAHAADKWTYEALDQYIADPKAYIKGNKMAYAGMKKLEDRANLLAYLASLSDTPVPYPAP